MKVCFLSVSLYQDVLCKMRHMFDLTEKRPAYWGPLEASSLRSAAERELTDLDLGTRLTPPLINIVYSIGRVVGCYALGTTEPPS